MEDLDEVKPDATAFLYKRLIDRIESHNTGWSGCGTSWAIVFGAKPKDLKTSLNQKRKDSWKQEFLSFLARIAVVKAEKRYRLKFVKKIGLPLVISTIMGWSAAATFKLETEDVDHLKQNGMDIGTSLRNSS